MKYILGFLDASIISPFIERPQNRNGNILIFESIFLPRQRTTSKGVNYEDGEEESEDETQMVAYVSFYTLIISDRKSARLSPQFARSLTRLADERAFGLPSALACKLVHYTKLNPCRSLPDLRARRRALNVSGLSIF